MIADKSTAMKVSGNLGGQKHAMGIDTAAMAHIMNVLTDLYSDPALAVIREYTTNAWDAHVEVGNTNPIHVTLPNPLSPFFKVRDFGVGLTEDDIAAIYSQYGASTKRATNDQVGMLGLGCKSALTYVQQFTLTSVKDGERVQVAISREAEGGSMTVVDRRPTDEPNGTEVTVPVKREASGSYDNFIAKAHRFFSYWPEGQVLVNGKAPERVDGFWLTPDILIRPIPNAGRYEEAKVKAVMGNVAYPVDTQYLSPAVNNGHEVVFFVPIGSVTFTPSRESLDYRDKTVNTLTELSKTFTKAARDAVQREIDAAKSPWEAIANMAQARSALRDAGAYGSYTFKGNALLSEYRREGGGWNANPDKRMLIVPRQSYVANRAESASGLSAEQFPGALWVLGYEGKKFSAPQKKKLVKFIEGRTDSAFIERFVLLLGGPDAETRKWIDPTRIVQWDDVNKIKLDRTPSNGYYGSYKSIPGSYDNCIVNGAHKSELPAANIDTSYPIYTYAGPWHYASNYAKVITEAGTKNYTIVPLPANRKDKFMRNFPAAIPVEDAVQAMAKTWLKSLTQDDKVKIKLHEPYYGRANDLRKLDATKVKDPALKKAIKLASADATKLLQKRQLFEQVIGSLDNLKPVWNNPLDGYPLFDASELRTELGLKHTYLYLNAAYAA